MKTPLRGLVSSVQVKFMGFLRNEPWKVLNLHLGVPARETGFDVSASIVLEIFICRSPF
jgi:hypothetical protein